MLGAIFFRRLMPTAVTRPPHHLQSQQFRVRYTHLPWVKWCLWCPLRSCHFLVVKEQEKIISGLSPQVGSHEKQDENGQKSGSNPGSNPFFRPRASFLPSVEFIHIFECTQGRRNTAPRSGALEKSRPCLRAKGAPYPYRGGHRGPPREKTKVVELLERNKNVQVLQRASHVLPLFPTAICEGLWAAPS